MMVPTDRKVKKTLILFTFWFGARRRHCGPDCYGDVKHTRRCQCLCGGINHGVGRDAAIATSKVLAFALVGNLKPTRHWICDEVRQMDLLNNESNGELKPND